MKSISTSKITQKLSKKKYEMYNAYQPEFHLKKIQATQILLYNECQ